MTVVEGRSDSPYSRNPYPALLGRAVRWRPDDLQLVGAVAPAEGLTVNTVAVEWRQGEPTLAAPGPE
jgi:hypothetical protein